MEKTEALAPEVSLPTQGCRSSGWPHDETTDQSKEPENCCNHQANRKFRLTFENSCLDTMDDCAKLTRFKCLSFWDFIDSDPALENLIKEGNFIHKNQPEQVLPKDKIKTGRKVNADKGNFRMSREEFQALHEGERQRLQKRRDCNADLEMRSGQTPFCRNYRVKETPKPEVVLATDACQETEAETILQMNKFDMSR